MADDYITDDKLSLKKSTDSVRNYGHDGTDWKRTKTDFEGNTIVTPSDGARSAFGEFLASELTPVVQLTFNYNINTDLVSTTLVETGTVTQTNGKAKVSSGATTASTARLESLVPVKYNAGQGGLTRFTAIFTSGVADTTQLIGMFDAVDGYALGFNGADFSILRRQDSSDTFVAQTSFSEDNLDGTGTSGMTLDATKGNVFEIRFQYLGFGAIEFCIENPSTGAFFIFHRIEYANANTTPSVFNPILPLAVFVDNNTTTSDIIVETGSMAGFVEGKNEELGTNNSKTNSKATITTETNIITIRNKSSFASKTNRIRIELGFFGVATDGTKNTTIRFVKNTTLGGTPSFADISTNTSVVDFDIAGTTLTGGTEVLALALAKVDAKELFLSILNILLNPTDTLTISATSANSTDVAVSIGWKELF